MARVRPARNPEQALNVALDVLREMRLEEVGLRARFELAHDVVRPEATIAAHHLQFVVRWQLIEETEQTGQCVTARVLVARLVRSTTR